MKTSRTTFVTLATNSFLNCVRNGDAVNLWLNDVAESIVIQFTPAHLTVLRMLVAGLEEIEREQQQAKMQSLRQQINEIIHPKASDELEENF